MMLQNFFQAFPKDIEEAGEIDGLSPVGIIIRILIPISLPAISSVTIINFMGTWNEFMYASIILRNPQLATFPIIIAQKVNAFSTYWGSSHPIRWFTCCRSSCLPCSPKRAWSRA